MAAGYAGDGEGWDGVGVGEGVPELNYYDHHIGDYAAATAHLSWDQDHAYTRLIRLYYRTEKPIPPDVTVACRLIQANSKAHKQAVVDVLAEFFELRDDGWHQKRCDEELAKMHESAEDNAARRENERDRQRRHRERRKEIFAALRERNIVPKYDTPLDQLETIMSQQCHEPVTRDMPSPVTDMQRLIHNPIANSQEPIANSQKPIANPTLSDKQKATGKTKRGANALAPDDPSWLPSEWKTYLQLRREKGASMAPTWRAESIKQLDAWRVEGYDIAEILRRSVSNGWTGIFPPNGNGMRDPPNRQEALEQRNRMVADSWIPPEMRDAEG